jgi:hypothetical protein
VTALLVAATLGLFTLHTSADPLDSAAPGTESVTEQKVIAEHFPAGARSPMIVIAPPGTTPSGCVRSPPRHRTLPPPRW